MLDPSRIPSPILFRGNEQVAYRDPAIYHDGKTFHLFFTYVDNCPGGPYLHLAKSTSEDLIHWESPRLLTERDKAKNYSSPGNIIRFRDRYFLCLQTYPRENGEKYGNANARIFLLESDDLEHFSEPRVLRVKGDTPVEELGRMIDPYLIEDRDEPGKWWCFYKQNGVSSSYSYDLEHWTYAGSAEAGENVCITYENGVYTMYHSPKNGIGVKQSTDLKHWTDTGLLTFGQAEWSWAKGRLTAGVLLDISHLCGKPMKIMLFHGSGPEDERVDFDKNASIGIVFSEDGEHWHWATDPEERRNHE